ncbi:OmpW/AlkL family protein [Pseudoalteromonas denitrificans]|uniref:Outer membrane protein n=1 Tax=Pseudoalteromonas denitrificans DSM 6059 TaxID=1123010 RepID=A0A1I1QQK3_9GAMM|nr:OmpW family outer membrane protein [Pseudoalteromonas denitrificans]SFD24394.1 outer membrane protein [Pseudoalteromonas denitrificans DSM 6059]
MRNVIKSTLVAASLIATPLAQAEVSLDKLSINIGAITVKPDSSTSYIDGTNNTLGLSVDSNTQLGITLDYAINDNWALELIAATPFSHDIDGEAGLDGASLGSTKHLPPTLLAQYHFGGSNAVFRPFIGAGINYTIFFDEQAGQDLKTTLGTNDVELKLDNSLGLAAQAGFNYSVNNKWAVHAVATYMDIDSDAEIFANGTKALTSTVNIDPVVFMLGMKYKF